MSDPKPLTRKELAEFLPSQRAIKAFEKLFDLVPSSFESLQEQINNILIQLGLRPIAKQSIVDIGSSYVLDKTINVVDADVKTTSIIECSIAPVADGYTRPTEEVIYERIMVYATPKNGSIDFYLQPERGHFKGEFVINYMVKI